jgi:Flp pilus assembly protein TadG
VSLTDNAIPGCLWLAFGQGDLSIFLDSEARGWRGHVGRAGAFLCRRDGVAALEFGLIAIPFFLFVFGILEVALVFWAGFELENATAAAARLVRTRQAQTAAWSSSQLTAQLCGKVVILSNCGTAVRLNVQTFSTFAGIAAPSALDQNGAVRNDFAYSLGDAGSIVLVTAYYEWTLTNPLTRAALANLRNGNYLLQASAAFRNEP